MKRVVTVLCLALLSGEVWAAQSLRVVNAWVREAPPSAKVHALYMTLENASAQPIVVTDIKGKEFERAELHITEHHAGMMHMKRLSEVSVAAGASLEFAPGGRHVMLFNARQAVHAGDQLNFTLVLLGGAEVPFTAAVVKKDAAGGAAAKQGDHDHGHHHEH